MRKNGFTLIELLAVIVILAIIALIATPIILGIINDAREKANERSVELYANAVRNGIAAYQLRTGNSVLPGTYTTLPFEVEYDGKVECTTIGITYEGNVTLEGCKVNNGDKEYSYGIKNKVSKICELSDEDYNEKYSIGDIVTCTFKESTEQFYVIENAGEDKTPQAIDMLAMYNLNVGNNPYKDGKIGIQNEAVGSSYGGVAFSLTNYWESSVSSYPASVYDERSNIYQYVNAYEEYLNSNGLTSASTTLLNYKQIESLGCDNYGCSNAPKWVENGYAEYWLDTAVEIDSIMFPGGSEFYYKQYAGVRPVATIATSEIELIYRKRPTTEEIIEIYKPQYYWFEMYSSGIIGDELPIGAKQDASEINTNGYPFYLGLDVEDGKVSAAYTCFTRNERQYCLKENDTRAYYSNKFILEEAFKDANNECDFGNDSGYCGSCGDYESLCIEVNSDGAVRARIDNTWCEVYNNGFNCNEK